MLHITKWGNEVLFLLPSEGYVLVKVALDNVLQRTLGKSKESATNTHTHTFKIVAVKYCKVMECEAIVKLNFNYM
jgi:hypothetical protein